jgi:hypothetical protein
MSSLTIDSMNRKDIQDKYVDSLMSRMDFMETRYLLRDYLHNEIHKYSNEDLLDEIRSKGSDYINDVFEGDCDRKVVMS